MMDTDKPTNYVLIVAYMRSGSSLTGDILQHANGSFYVYEPLHIIEKAVIYKLRMAQPDGGVR